MKYVKLGVSQIRSLLIDIPKWKFIEKEIDSSVPDTLLRKYTFKSFEETWAFLNRVALRSHKLGHHPKITNTYNVVDLELTTHDVGGLSEVDFKMAKAFDKAAIQYGLTNNQ